MRCNKKHLSISRPKFSNDLLRGYFIKAGLRSGINLHILKKSSIDIPLFFPVFPTSISLVEALLKYLHIIILP